MAPKSSSTQRKPNRLDGLKWFTVMALLCAGLYANYFYSSVAWAVRTAVGIVVLIVLISVALQTAKGQKAWDFIKGARVELRKVVWPTRQETIQTTLIVVVMVVIAAVVLWGLDSLFLLTVAWLTGQRG